ncbi:MAG: rhodanese-like domain-containing protein [Methylophagaceae bacterium]
MSYNAIAKTLLLAVFALLIACSSPDATALDQVSAVQAAEMVKVENAVIIDVREQDEWNAGHIPGAIHIPLGQVKTRLAEFEAYQDQPIVMQCRSGRRSAAAATILLDAGFENVSNLSGGILAWGKSDLPLEK